MTAGYIMRPLTSHLQGRFVSPEVNSVTGIFDEFVTPDEDDSNNWIPGKHARILYEGLLLRGYLRRYDGRGEVIADELTK